MNEILFNLFPGGLNKCLTMSYDDGNPADERLAEIFRKNGIKGTFHLNSCHLNLSSPEETERLCRIYDGHEVSCHTVNHSFPVDQPNAALAAEIIEDRRALEKAFGYPIRGMSYPYGCYNARVISVYRTAGMEYSRTTNATNNFNLPDDFMEWHPTCHHSQSLMARADDFLADNRDPRLKLFYVWGHSYEFVNNNNWELIENFCEKVGNRNDIWYAANIEIVDYINALHALRFTVNCDTVYNPSVLDVWFTASGKTVHCPAGKTVAF